jgi:hypothetical protein
VKKTDALTLDHIVELRRFKDEENPLPMVLLLDNKPDDQTNEFFAALVQRAKKNKVLVP